MTKYFGCHNGPWMLLATLVLASMIINSNCRPLALEEDQNLHMESVIKQSSRDEMVRMAGYGEEKLSTVLITGTVACNKHCNQHCSSAKLQQHPFLPEPIPGALVGATCETDTKEERASLIKAVTDQYGEFIIDVPSHLHGIPDFEKACSLIILELPENSPCHQPVYTGIKNEIVLSALGNGIRTYTAGMIAFLNMVSKKSAGCKGLADEVEMSW